MQSKTGIKVLAGGSEPMRLQLDTREFLQALKQLQRALQARITACGPIDVRNQALELFAATGLAGLCTAAAHGGERTLLAQCQSHLARIATVIRHAGLGAWLVDTMENAIISQSTGRVCQDLATAHAYTDMYLQWRPFSRLVADHYVSDSIRLAAHSLLKWAPNDPRAAHIALLLLSHTGMGMEKLQRVEKGRSWDADLARHYEMLEIYGNTLQINSDIGYAAWLHESNIDMEREAEWSDQAMRRRYLYDAKWLVKSYIGLWRRTNVPTADELAAGLEDGEDSVIERKRAWGDQWEDKRRKENESQYPWNNPIFLRSVAHSLLADGSCLTQAFERRDRDTFRKACAILQRYCDVVHGEGLAALPLTACDYTVFPTDCMDSMAALMLARVPEEHKARHMALMLLEDRAQTMYDQAQRRNASAAMVAW